MTRFNAWNVFKNGLIGQTDWDRQWRDPEPKKEYDVIIVGGVCMDWQQRIIWQKIIMLKI